MTSEDALGDLTPGNTDWDALSTFFGAYLNQDFVDEFGGPWETVRGFVRAESPTYVLRTADQVHRLLMASDDDEQTERAIERLGMGYRPTGDGWTCRGWLAELEGRLRDELRERDRRG